MTRNILNDSTWIEVDANVLQPPDIGLGSERHARVLGGPLRSTSSRRVRPRSQFDPLLLGWERSAIAAATLRTMGYRDVRVLDGGIEAWKREGLPVELP